MTVLRVGLVTEGPTDQIVIRTLLAKYFDDLPPNQGIVFVDLQPTRDLTSGSIEGGWELVYAWCLRNPPEIRHSQYFESGLFDDGMDTGLCDLIVVHLDSDICSKVAKKVKSRSDPGSNASAQERGEFVEAVIRDWLWPNGEHSDDRHIPAPAVESIETWLLAGLGTHDAPEEIQDPGLTLVYVDHTVRGKVPPDKAKRIKKTPRRYQLMSERAALNVNSVVDKCRWFKTLVNRVRPHLS